MNAFLKKGQIAVELLFLSAIVVALITGFVSLAASLLNISVRGQNKLQAFAISEAGIEYYRWHLAHAPTDYTDGTGQAGPYVHQYYDKDGTLIGSFSLDITPPPPGSSIVTIESTGKVVADPSVQKVIEVKLGSPSYLDYSILLNGNVYFGTGTVTYGTIFANGGINFNGIAYGPVMSALTTYSDPNDSNKTEWAVHTDLSPADPQPPTPLPTRADVFTAGRFVGQPAIDFTAINETLAALKAQAQASGTYFGPSMAYGYELQLATSGIYSMYKVTSLAKLPNSCTNTSNEPDWGVWSVGNETLVATGTIPDVGGVIFSEDNLWVKGQIQGKHLTIAAGRFPVNPATYADITINSSTLYTYYNGSDSLAYVAQNNFNVGLFSDDVLRIDGAIVAQNGRIGRFYYAPPNTQSNSQKCGDTVTRTKITLYGSMISGGQYGFGFSDSTGYQEKDIIFDPNLRSNPPPYFPTLSSQYVPMSWEEVQ
jgi:hypothetical protein